MTALHPWREIAEPRKDIADGSFNEWLFAADLADQVSRAGRATLIVTAGPRQRGGFDPWPTATGWRMFRT